MARIYYAADGSVLRLTRTDAEDAAFGAPPGAAGSIAFDEASNADAIDGLSGRIPGVRWQDHDVSGGQLRRKGQPVTLAGDAPATADRKGFVDNVDAMVAEIAADIGGVDASSNAELRNIVKRLLQRQRRVVKRLAQLMGS